MQNKEIGNFSLSKIIDRYGLRPEDMYFDGCLIASQVNMEDEEAINMFRYPVRLNAYAIAFCTKGTVTLTSNLNHYTLQENDLYVHLPGTIVQIDTVENAEVYIVSCEEDFIRNINVDLKLLTRLFLQVEQHPMLSLKPEDWETILISFKEIEREGKEPEKDIYTMEVIRTALRLIIYKACRIIAQHIENKPEPHGKGSRHQEYFHKFMRLLENNYLQERSLTFYASQMNLTPKYLTTIIREVSGKTAITWIDAYVILEAKNLLKFSSMSIQEISYYLHFPNQSFFGKYFRNHTGMTPSVYRNEI